MNPGTGINNMKKLSKVFVGIAMPLIMLLIIFLSVEALAGDRAWLKREYDKLDINWYTGMSTDDQIRAFMQMVDYMQGRTSTMDVTVTVDGEEMLMYNEREISHMHDVRTLYITLTVAKWFVIAFAAVTLGLSLAVFKTKEEKRELLRFASKAAIVAFVCVFLLIIAAGLWAVLDFDSFWAEFHNVFLDLESSTFDPAYSRMIRICPAELFEDMVLRMFAVAFAAAFTFTALLFILNKAVNRRRGAAK